MKQSLGQQSETLSEKQNKTLQQTSPDWVTKSPLVVKEAENVSIKLSDSKDRGTREKGAKNGCWVSQLIVSHSYCVRSTYCVHVASSRSFPYIILSSQWLCRVLC